MRSLAGEFLVGTAYGLVMGTTAALVCGLVGFYLAFDDVYDPPLEYVLAALLAAGIANALLVGMVQGGPELLVRLVVAVGLVPVAGLFGYSQGVRLAENLPLETERETERRRHLAGDAIDAVDASGQVTIKPAGPVRDLEGYPALPPGLRTELSDESWSLPADLPLSELATRIEARLRTEYDLAEVLVSVDSRGQATIAAAPPRGGLAEQVPDGWRAVTVETLVPTGLAPGDTVCVRPDGDPMEGIVLATDVRGSTPDANTGGDGLEPDDSVPAAGEGMAGDAETDPDQASVHGREASPGGWGRVTLAVEVGEAGRLLDTKTVRIDVLSTSTRDDVAAFGTFEAADMTVRKLTLDDSVLETLPQVAEKVSLLAVRPRAQRDDHRGWVFDPHPGKSGHSPNQEGAGSDAGDTRAGGDRLLEPGGEVFVVGDRAVLHQLADDATTPTVEVTDA